jgi:hypothetical protein
MSFARRSVCLALLLLASCGTRVTSREFPELEPGSLHFFATLAAHTDTRFLTGNRVEILLDGDGTFPLLLEAIRNARRTNGPEPLRRAPLRSLALARPGRAAARALRVAGEEPAVKRPLDRRQATQRFCRKCASSLAAPSADERARSAAVHCQGLARAARTMHGRTAVGYERAQRGGGEHVARSR